MRDADISDMRDALAALKREDARVAKIRQGRRRGGRLAEFRRETQSQLTGFSEVFASEETAFRGGVSSRLKAHDLLASPGLPATPIYTRLEKPFLIWAFRDGRPIGILDETHIEPLNSWARFRTRWQQQGVIGPKDEVVFYFMWQNDTPGDAVVDVESHLLLNGSCWAYAESGWIPPIWWGTGTFGEMELGIDAELKLLEWWNQPASQPLQQPAQSVEIAELRVEGGFTLGSWGAKLGGEARTLLGSHYLHYNGFLVPAGAVAVFEVSLRMHYGGFNGGSCEVDFLEPARSSLVCPYVELATQSAPLSVDG
jgi:hypothetical protein